MSKSMDEMELLASVFESSLDAKLIVFSDGKIYRANRAAERIFLTPGLKDLKNRNVLTLVKGKSRQEFKNFLSSMRQNQAIHQELILRINNDLRVFDVTGNASIMGDVHLIIMRDITEKARDREAREQFIAIAGHELKTPLAVISAYTDLLKRKCKDDASMLLYLNKISSKNKVLTNYIESIMDEIRIGAGRFSYNDKEHKFDSIVIEAIRELRKAYPEAKLVGMGKTQKTVRVDKERIAQVVRNLVVNAIKHSPKGKEISIELRPKKQTVYFSVKDQGRGIPKREQDQIFKAFYRSGSKSTQKKSGLGLGLFIAKQIVRQYGGNIGVVSKVGGGAKFYFEIPYVNSSKQ